MTRFMLVGVAIGLLCLISITVGDEPPAPSHVLPAGPPQRELSPTQHLDRAAAHLRAAGEVQLAEQVAERAETRRKDLLRRIDEKRLEINWLTQELSELEELAATGEMVAIKCLIADVDMKTLKRLGLSGDYSAPDQVPVKNHLLNKDIIEGLTEEGLAKVVASPTIVTRNRRPATFHSGGEFPVVVPQGPDQSTIAFRPFGLTMETVPEIQEEGRVRLDVSTELSRRDFTNAVTSNGVLTPGLQVRQINTQIETTFGQTTAFVFPVSYPFGPTKPQKILKDGSVAEPENLTVICVTPELIAPTW